MNIERCWNQVGILGDRTCPELAKFTHCRNCPIYSTAGRGLLERSIPENYRQVWTQLLAQTDVEETKAIAKTIPVIIFRLQQEWFALPAKVFKETTHPSKIHKIPHRSNEILQGLVNIRGELQLCVSLKNLLNLKISDRISKNISPIIYPRMVLVESDGNIWVFSVDELYGVQKIALSQLQGIPAKTGHNYSKALFQWGEHSVNYLDDELLFSALARG